MCPRYPAGPPAQRLHGVGRFPGRADGDRHAPPLNRAGRVSGRRTAGPGGLDYDWVVPPTAGEKKAEENSRYARIPGAKYMRGFEAGVRPTPSRGLQRASWSRANLRQVNHARDRKSIIMANVGACCGRDTTRLRQSDFENSGTIRRQNHNRPRDGLKARRVELVS